MYVCVYVCIVCAYFVCVCVYVCAVHGPAPAAPLPRTLSCCSSPFSLPERSTDFVCSRISSFSSFPSSMLPAMGKGTHGSNLLQWFRTLDKNDFAPLCVIGSRWLFKVGRCLTLAGRSRSNPEPMDILKFPTLVESNCSLRIVGRRS